MKKHITLLSIDIAKSVFELYGVNQHQKRVFSERVSRQALLLTIVKHVPTTAQIVMEACGSAHHWGRALLSAGYSVKLISPQHVKPFVRGNKNDRNDAKGIALAAHQEDMPFVDIKTRNQQALLSLHRAKALATQHRVALGNQIRGLLAEYGVVFQVGVQHFKKLPALLEQHAEQLIEIKPLLEELYEAYKETELRIKRYLDKLTRFAQDSEDCQRLMKLSGVGVIIATYIWGAVGKATSFHSGRQLSAWLGLVPQHRASGNQLQMGGISKRGDGYLRKLLVQGARAVMVRSGKKTDRRSVWINEKKSRMHASKVAVALANKIGREVYAVLRKGDDFVFNPDWKNNVKQA